MRCHTSREEEEEKEEKQEGGSGEERARPVLTLRLMKPFRCLCRARTGCTRRNCSENHPCTFAIAGKSVFMRISIQGEKKNKYQSLNLSVRVADLLLFFGWCFGENCFVSLTLKLFYYHVKWHYLTTTSQQRLWRQQQTQGGMRRFRKEGCIKYLSTRPSLFPLSWKISCQAAMRSLR